MTLPTLFSPLFAFAVRRIAPLFALLCIALPSGAAEQESSPEALVKQVTEEVLAAVKQDPALRAGDRRKALALAEEKVLPYIDFEEATRLAVGRAWNDAAPEQRQRLVNEFRSMLVRIYSNAIESYRGQTMDVQRARLNGPEEASVRNLYRRPGAQPVAIDYAMRKTAQGWKVYDVTVEGISLVLTYRAQFAQALRQGGVDGLIKQMAALNSAPPMAAKS